MTREEDWSYAAFILTSGQTAVKGEMACLDTSNGNVTPGQASTTLVPIGYFGDDVTGDGTLTVRVRLFRESKLHWFANDTNPNNVTAANIGSEVYIKDSKTVTTASSGNSKGGRVWAVNATYGVLLEMGIGVTGPTGAGSASGNVADRATLKAIAAAARYDGQLVMVLTDNSLWRFNASSTAAADGADELVCVPGAGSGRWIRADKAFIARIPISFANTDNQTIWTVPTGFVLKLTAHPFWDVAVGFTGGSSSAIGVHASDSGYTSKGDLIGGAAGDVAATLVAGLTAGTAGGKLDTVAHLQGLLLQAADTLKFDRITSAFNAGSGFVCVPVTQVVP
jgi:hypothetical protein